jgi:hypothetical protein
MAPINSESSLECFIPLNSRITCIFVERPATASCRVHGRIRTCSNSRRGHSPKTKRDQSLRDAMETGQYPAPGVLPLLPAPTPKGTTWVFERATGVLAELGHPPNQNRPLIEKPGKIAGLIESIDWTNAETTKLNNAQWRWLGPDSAIPQAMTKQAQTRCAVCSKLLTFWSDF